MGYYVTSTESSKVNGSTLMSPSPRWRTGLCGGRLGEDGQAISNFSFIGGGECNRISGNGQQHSFIAGGHCNTVGVKCSAILGGCGNTVTHPYAAVFGKGVNSVAGNTFHVECLNAVNTPTGPGPFPAGTFSYAPTAVLPPGALGFLVIW